MAKHMTLQTQSGQATVHAHDDGETVSLGLTRFDGGYLSVTTQLTPADAYKLGRALMAGSKACGLVRVRKMFAAVGPVPPGWDHADTDTD